MESNYMSMTSQNKITQVDSSNAKSSLLQSVIEGNEDLVLATLDNADIKILEELLLYQDTVTDFSGRKIEGTALQLALGAEDTLMCEMMMPFFDKIPNGQMHKLQQYNIQYPDNNANENNAQDFQALEKVMAAIESSNSDEECEVALTEFRNYLKPTSVIKTGKHFNAALLVEALRAYGHNYIRFGGWNSDKNNLCWTNVIGYLERQLPACYGQAFCQGLINIVEYNQLLQRSFRFLHADYDLFPLDTAPSYRLGYDYAAGPWGFWDGKSSAQRAIKAEKTLQKYIEKKRQSLIALVKS
jgi:hypothetical protein